MTDQRDEAPLGEGRCPTCNSKSADDFMCEREDCYYRLQAAAVKRVHAERRAPPSETGDRSAVLTISPERLVQRFETAMTIAVGADYSPSISDARRKQVWANADEKKEDLLLALRSMAWSETGDRSAVLERIEESVRRGYLFDNHDEPLNDYGKRIVRCILLSLKNAAPQVKTVVHDAVALNAHGSEGLTAAAAQSSTDTPNLDGGMEAKEGTFPDKLRSNAAYLMSFYGELTEAEAKVIADKLEQAATALSAIAAPKYEIAPEVAEVMDDALASGLIELLALQAVGTIKKSAAVKKMLAAREAYKAALLSRLDAELRGRP